MSHPNQRSKTESAQLRANISTLLANAPTQDFATEDIAETLKISTRATGQMLGYMAKGKLIIGPIKHKGDKRKHWKWPSTPANSTPDLPPTDRRVPSLLKAIIGAERVLRNNEKQSAVARELSVNINRLNRCVQLLRLDNEVAAQTVGKIRENPTMSEAEFDALVNEALGTEIPRSFQDEVEIVAGGRVIVVGTNPRTGRLRITIET